MIGIVGVVGVIGDMTPPPEPPPQTKRISEAAVVAVVEDEFRRSLATPSDWTASNGVNAGSVKAEGGSEVR